MERVSERKIIDIITRQCSINAPIHSGFSGTGDDCAILEAECNGHSRLAVTTDTMIEGVHFSMDYFSPWHLGEKLAAINLSDIAAQGARPRWAFLNLAIPERWRTEDAFIIPFSKGLCTMLGSFGAVLAGGDTVSCPDRLSLSLTLIGETGDQGWLSRKGASPGDIIFCSGWLGEAAAGLLLLSSGKKDLCRFKHSLSKNILTRLAERHLSPTPRVELGRLLAKGGLATAAMDMSDGLATDLAHLCEMSRCGAILFEEAIPISRALKIFCRQMKNQNNSDNSALELALRGGEDFELLWTVRPEMRAMVMRQATRLDGIKPFAIGRITEGSGVFIEGKRGIREITFQGYEH